MDFWQYGCCSSQCTRLHDRADFPAGRRLFAILPQRRSAETAIFQNSYFGAVAREQLEFSQHGAQTAAQDARAEGANRLFA